MSSTFTGAACPSTSACFAVGSYTTADGDRHVLAERWSPDGWRRYGAPSPGSDTGLLAVACADASWCLAAGSSGVAAAPEQQRALLEAWDGGAWSIWRPPIPPGPSSFQALACSSRSWCKAVGWASSDGVVSAFVDSWNGHAWSPVETPPPSELATDGGLLESVACEGERSCVAVGLVATNDGGDGTQTLAESWTGAGWALVAAPSPYVLAGDNSTLDSVACTSVAACVAVGSTDVGNVFAADDRALIESWDGRAWALAPVSLPGPSLQSALAAVSCPAPRSCVAAGWTIDRSFHKGGLVESSRGAGWSVAANPLDSGYYSAVACPAPGVCLLAGQRTGAADPLGEATAAWFESH